jgi:hypothetical protein
MKFPAERAAGFVKRPCFGGIVADSPESRG